MRFPTRAAALAVVAVLLASVVLLSPVTAQAPTELPPDLALVPADAAGFVHVRAAELWKNEIFAQFRQTFEKAGPKALAALESQFVPKVSTFDRLTAFVMLDDRSKQPLSFGVLRFTADFDADQVVKEYLPSAKKTMVGTKAVYSSPQAEFALYFPDKRHIVVGLPEGFAAYLSHATPKSGAMSAGLKLAASGKAVVGSVNITALPIPPKVFDDLPPDVKPLLKAENITAPLDASSDLTIQLSATYKNAADAQSAEQAITKLAEMGRKELAKAKEDIEKKIFASKGLRPGNELPEAILMIFVLGGMNRADELLANPGAYVKRNGSDLSVSLTVPKETVKAIASSYGAFSPVMIGLLLPAVQKVREAAGRAQSQNNLKQIALAIHAYHDGNGFFPHDIVDKNGKPILSWRVQLLPYLEEANLYNQFKLDEPWDSKNNKPLSEMAVKVFMSPLANPPAAPGTTNYKAFVGPGTVFEPGKKIRILDIKDGSSNTIMAIETADAIPWAKPGDIPFDASKPLPKLVGTAAPNMVNVMMCDGSVRMLDLMRVSEKTLKAAITRAGGEPPGSDWPK